MDMAQVLGHQEIRKEVMLKGRKGVNVSEMIGVRTVEIAQLEEHYNGLHAALKALVGQRNEKATKLAELKGDEKPQLKEYEPDKEAGIESLQGYAKALGSAVEQLDKQVAEEEKKTAEAGGEKGPEPIAQRADNPGPFEVGQPLDAVSQRLDGECGSITESVDPQERMHPEPES